MTSKGIKEISVFVDESGSFDPFASSSQFYIICLLFHDQSQSLSEIVDSLNSELKGIGLDANQAIHAGPLIRWEQPYRNLRRQDRRIIFSKLLAFMRRADITYRCFAVDKRFIYGRKTLHDRLLQQMVAFLISHTDEFNSYDKLKVYYDNGQSALTSLIKEAFSIFSSRTEYTPDVEPSKYRLFQVADIVCTLELAREKLSDDSGLSESETVFFGGIKNLKKNYLKILDRKILV